MADTVSSGVARKEARKAQRKTGFPEEKLELFPVGQYFVDFRNLTNAFSTLHLYCYYLLLFLYN